MSLLCPRAFNLDARTLPLFAHLSACLSWNITRACERVCCACAGPGVHAQVFHQVVDLVLKSSTFGLGFGLGKTGRAGRVHSVVPEATSDQMLYDGTLWGLAAS
jgi:hypothetical protein